MPFPCVSMDVGLGHPILHVTSPCVSLDGSLGPPIVHVLSPSVSIDRRFKTFYCSRALSTCFFGGV